MAEATLYCDGLACGIGKFVSVGGSTHPRGWKFQSTISGLEYESVVSELLDAELALAKYLVETGVARLS